MAFESNPAQGFTEIDCIFALFRAKWPNGFRCHACGHNEAYCIKTRRLPLYECKLCRTQTSLIAGTVMARSRLPLVAWFRAIELHASPQSVNALQLSRILTVTYKTAWLICHKIRHAMSQAEATQLLSGLVKITDAIYCKATSADIFNWQPHEQALLIGSSASKPEIIDQIKIQVLNRRTLRNPYQTPDATNFIVQNVAVASQAHVIVSSHCRGKRNWALIHIGKDAEHKLAFIFGGIGPKHLQTYLNQYCYNWNRQHLNEAFDELLSHCAKYCAIDYRTLVGNNPNSSPNKFTDKQPLAS